MPENKLRTFLLASIPAACVLLVTVGGIAVNSRGARVGAERSGEGDPAAPSSPLVKKDQYTKEEFDRAIPGKTAKEVIFLLGQPESTSKSSGSTSESWFYRNGIVFDATAGKPFHLVMLRLKDGRVVSVSY